MFILLIELHRMFTEKTVSAIQDAMQYFTFVLKQVKDLLCRFGK